MSIFRAYDIRGIYGEDLTDEIANKIGRAYVTLMKTNEVVVGEDCRNSSPAITKALVDGMNSAGADVYNIDMVPGPLVSFYLAVNKKTAGVYVTASHNPPEYNGFKLMNGLLALSPEEIQRIGKLADGKNFLVGNGRSYKRDVIGDYISYMRGKFKAKGLRVVIDSSNGTCGTVAPSIFKDIGCYVTELFSEPNGSFPNHYPDPTRAENLTEVKRRVTEDGADLGIAFDGDGDRVVFIDETGKDIKGDQALMLFARQILEKQKGKIIYTVNCSRAVAEDIQAHGGTPLVNVVGHSFIKKRLFDENALLAGEMSGHFFFRDDYFGFDDAVYSALRMVQLLTDTGKKLSELVAGLPKYFTSPEERIACPDDKKFKIVESLKKDFSSYKQITIDGVRVEFEHGWALARASNTEPILSIRFEADSESEKDKIRADVMAVLKKYGIS